MNRQEEEEMQDQAAKISQCCEILQVAKICNTAKFLAPHKILPGKLNSCNPRQLLLQYRTQKIMNLNTGK